MNVMTGLFTGRIINKEMRVETKDESEENLALEKALDRLTIKFSIGTAIFFALLAIINVNEIIPMVLVTILMIYAGINYLLSSIGYWKFMLFPLAGILCYFFVKFLGLNLSQL